MRVQIPLLQGQVSLSLSCSFLISTMEEKEYQTMRVAVGIKSNMACEVLSRGQAAAAPNRRHSLFLLSSLPLAGPWEPPGLLCRPHSPIPPLPSFLYKHPPGPTCVLLHSEIRLRKMGRGVGNS